MNGVLNRWNTIHPREALTEILPSNGSLAWAEEVVQRRPFANEKSLFAAADEVWQSLPRDDWQQAFDSHPRIGDRHAKAASATSLQWSAGEQSAAGDADAIKARLAEGNQEYEERFGRIFLVCATGKTAEQMLAILQLRLANDTKTELLEAAEQQRRITQLRLRKWLGLPPARCEDV